MFMRMEKTFNISGSIKITEKPTVNNAENSLVD